MIKNRFILDLVNMKAYSCGDADFDLLKHLPAGTEAYDLTRATSGHLVIPCCNYKPRAAGGDGMVFMNDTEPEPQAVPEKASSVSKPTSRGSAL